MIGRSKLTYFADYHARHERVKLCNLRNEKREYVKAFMYCLCTAFTTHYAIVVGLYFDANVVHISNILFFYCVKGVKNKMLVQP